MTDLINTKQFSVDHFQIDMSLVDYMPKILVVNKFKLCRDTTLNLKRKQS